MRIITGVYKEEIKQTKLLNGEDIGQMNEGDYTML